VPLARFVARHIDQLGVPFKRYAIGSVFRGERPAKGRFREFVQCDFDTIGTESAVADAETAQMIHASLVAAGVPDFTITLNNRKILDGFLELEGLSDRSAPVLRALDKLAKIGRAGVIDELQRPVPPPKPLPDTVKPIRREDAGEPHPPVPESGASLTAEQAARVLDFSAAGRGGVEVLELARKSLERSTRAAEGLSNLQTVLDLLAAAGVPRERFAVDLGLARGLDYYTGIVFETTIDGWEKFGSVASGGRYDNLASLFTPRRLPGVGASIGLDRLLALLEEAGKLVSSGTMAEVLVANFPGTNPGVPFGMAARLRAAGVTAEVYPDPISIGKQMGYGSSRGHKLAVIVGPDEESKRVFNLRDLASRQEDKGLAWSVLEDSVQSALEIIKQGGAGK
jgi:histidyl-tRNA synthetase